MIQPQQTTWKSAGSALLPLAVLSLLVITPLGLLVGETLPDNAAELEALRGLLLDSPLQRSIIQTFAVALLACGLASTIAIPAAFIAVRTGPRLRILIQLFGFLPLTMPPFVGAAMLQHFSQIFNQTGAAGSLGELGVEGSSIALALVFALHYLPLILFSLMTGLARIDRGHAESARTLGGSRLVVWRRITLPLANPAYVVGASLMILKIFEDVGTPLMLGVEGMLAPQILLRLGDAGLSDPMLNITALALLSASLLIVALAWSALLPSLGLTRVGECDDPMRWRRGLSSTLTAAVLTIVLGALTMAPHLWLIVTSLGTSWSGDLLPDTWGVVHYHQALSGALPHFQDTLLYVSAAGVLTLLLGGAFGSLTTGPGAVARTVRFAATALFAIPGVVLALSYLRMQGLIDTRLAEWSGYGWLALLSVVALKQLPFAQRLVAHGLRTLQHGELESAHNLGSTALGARLRVGLPVMAGVLAGVFLLGFSAATLELSAVLLLIQDPQVPLAHSLYLALQSPAGAGVGAAQGLALGGLVGMAFLLAHTLLRQRCRRQGTGGGRHSHEARDQI